MFSGCGQVIRDAQTSERELEPEHEALQNLLNRRQQFVQQRMQPLGRLDKGIIPIAARPPKRHIARLERKISGLDVEYREVLEKCILLADRAALYRTVPNVRPLTSATLVARLPELVCSNSKSLNSLLQLPSWSRDSGEEGQVTVLSEDGEARCGVPCTYAPGRRYATIANCVASISVVGN